MANWTAGVLTITGKVEDIKNFKNEIDRLKEEDDFEYAIIGFNFDENDDYRELEKFSKDNETYTLRFYEAECRWSFGTVEDYAREEGGKTLKDQSKDFNLNIKYKGYEPGISFIEIVNYKKGVGESECYDYKTYFDKEGEEWLVDCEYPDAYGIIEDYIEWLNFEYPEGEEE